MQKYRDDIIGICFVLFVSWLSLASSVSAQVQIGGSQTGIILEPTETEIQLEIITATINETVIWENISTEVLIKTKFPQNVRVRNELRVNASEGILFDIDSGIDSRIDATSQNVRVDSSTLTFLGDTLISGSGTGNVIWRFAGITDGDIQYFSLNQFFGIAKNINLTSGANLTANRVNANNWCDSSGCYTLTQLNASTTIPINNIFDQSLNTTDNVTFNQLTVTRNITAQNISAYRLDLADGMQVNGISNFSNDVNFSGNISGQNKVVNIGRGTNLTLSLFSKIVLIGSQGVISQFYFDSTSTPQKFVFDSGSITNALSFVGIASFSKLLLTDEIVLGFGSGSLISETDNDVDNFYNSSTGMMDWRQQTGAGKVLNGYNFYNDPMYIKTNLRVVNNLSVAGNTTFESLVTSLPIILPDCSTASNSSIATNNTGLYFCGGIQWRLVSPR